MSETNLTKAAHELEKLREAEQSSNNDIGVSQHHRNILNTRFPSNCLKLLYSIPGNLRCVDCGATNPQWAALTFGALICIDCSGRHRQMGVQVSVVRSITMDSWQQSDILAMLEGGNKQLGDFFQRHGLSPTTGSCNDVASMNRYKTNGAKFYKKNLCHHVSRVTESGLYKGRETFRKSPQKTKRRYVTADEMSITANGYSKDCGSLSKSRCEAESSVTTNA